MFIESSIYKIIMNESIISTVDVIFINKNNQILLWLRTNEPLGGVYYIPGGRRNKNEKKNDSAYRKMKEELWITIDTSRLVFLWTYDDIFENSMFEGISSHYSSVTYVYKLTSEEETAIWITDSQHSNIKFFDLENPSLHEMVKIRISDIQNKKLLS
jgi:ADP-ribose pyrophosphatase YjhB (NUDIX family)